MLRIEEVQLAKHSRRKETVISRGKAGRTSGAGLLERPAALLFVVVILLLAQPPGHAQAPAGDALPYAMSFAITGNYVVGSVDLKPQSVANGFITGTIHINGVPANADVL